MPTSAEKIPDPLRPASEVPLAAAVPRRRILWWCAFGLWVAAVLTLSSIPGNQFEGPKIPYFDKFVHFTIFAIGAIPLSLALRDTLQWRRRAIAVAAITLLTLIGITDELHQLNTPHRSGGDRGDILADALGGAFGVIFTLSIHARLRPGNRPRPPRGTPRPNPAA